MVLPKSNPETPAQTPETMRDASLALGHSERPVRERIDESQQVAAGLRIMDRRKAVLEALAK